MLAIRCLVIEDIACTTWHAIAAALNDRLNYVLLVRASVLITSWREGKAGVVA